MAQYMVTYNLPGENRNEAINALGKVPRCSLQKA